MIGSSKRDEAIGVLQAEGAATKTQLAALMTQVAALTARVEAGFEQHAAAAAEWESLAARLNERADRLEAELLARFEAVEAQVAVLAALESAGEQQAEAIRQLRGDIARLGLQATCDLDEMRRSDAALAELILARSPGSTRAR